LIELSSAYLIDHVRLLLLN